MLLVNAAVVYLALVGMGLFGAFLGYIAFSPSEEETFKDLLFELPPPPIDIKSGVPSVKFKYQISISNAYWFELYPNWNDFTIDEKKTIKQNYFDDVVGKLSDPELEYLGTSEHITIIKLS
jgi:hypothetical protein